MNFFAILAGTETECVRIPLEQALQATMEQTFHQQLSEFIDEDTDEIPFDPAHNPDQSQIALIGEYGLPDSLANALNSPLDQPVLSSDHTNRICGIAALDANDGIILAQTFNRTQVLDNSGFSLVLSGDTYRRLSDSGFTVGKRLVAVWASGSLRFRSFFNANRVFPLESYFSEATDTEVDAFQDNPKIALESPEAVTSNLDRWLRKHIAILGSSSVLADLEPDAIAARAIEFDLLIEVTESDGQSSIVLPNNKKRLKEIVRFLEENYYESPLTGTRFVANSKHEL